ncbi:MAG: lipase family protein [Bryobacterales bacterium]|nr:lipase family protein [Bryobacterales bacterium]
MSSSSVTLNCRLLSACGCAYYIDPATGKYVVPSDDKFSPVVGWKNTPAPVSAAQINACLVGENSDGIIVAFRGTLPPDLHSADSILDWLQDFLAEPGAYINVPGKVHTGIYLAVMSIIAEVAAQVNALSPAGKKIYVTGHSKGGAMASIGAWILHNTNQLAISQVISFASPKPGDTRFQQAFQALFHNPAQVRYENYDDIVPLLPPSAAFIKLMADIPFLGDLFKQAEGWDYQHVGILQYIESREDQYKVIPDNPLLMTERLGEIMLEISEDLVDWDFNSFGDAHTLQCGFGYMSGVCPSSVCGQPSLS